MSHGTGFTEQDNLIPWHLQKSFKKEASGHGQVVEQKNRCPPLSLLKKELRVTGRELRGG